MEQLKFNMKGEACFKFDQDMKSRKPEEFGGLDQILSINVIPGIEQNVTKVGIETTEMIEFSSRKFCI